MIKKFLILFCFLFVSFCAGINAEMKNISFLKDGKSAGEVSYYSFGGSKYLNASEASKVLGAKLYIYPVSGKVVMQMRNTKIVFDENSDEIVSNSQKSVFAQPLIVRSGIPFITLEYFESSAFKNIFDYSISEENKTAAKKEVQNNADKAVSVNSYAGVITKKSGDKANILSVKCGEHPDKTRIVMTSDADTNWTEEKQNGLFIVTINNAWTENTEPQNLSSDIVESIKINQKENCVTLTAKLADGINKTNVFTLSNPHRIVVDIFKTQSENRNDIAREETIKAEPEIIQTLEETSEEQKDDTGNTSADISEYEVIQPIKATQVDTIIEESSNSLTPNVSKKNSGTNTKNNVNENTGGDAGLSEDLLRGLNVSGIQVYSANDIVQETESKRYPKESITVSSPVPNIPDKININDGGKKKIVVDAGHGGKDPGGKKKFGLTEKQLNLLVAKEVKKMFAENDKFEVVLTRDEDVFIPLSERSEIANNAKADIFVSIHGNAVNRGTENGFEIYFMSETASDPGAAQTAELENSVVALEDPEHRPDIAGMLLHSMARNEYMNDGSRLAGLVAVEMERLTPFKNRGVKQAAFYVLRGTYAPGILVEMGFMTNSSDQKNLNDKSVRIKIAKSIYNGIIKYAEMKGWK